MRSLIRRAKQDLRDFGRESKSGLNWQPICIASRIPPSIEKFPRELRRNSGDSDNLSIANIEESVKGLPEWKLLHVKLAEVARSRETKAEGSTEPNVEVQQESLRPIALDQLPAQGDAPGVGSETARRAQLLESYKAATDRPSNRRIYTAKNSGIHKPQFHSWLKGQLPITSETTKNFERFLREKKKPTPKTPHL